MMDVAVDIFRGTSRFTDRGEGRMTWHAFSFGQHYDPDRVGFGPMVCHDEHLLAQGRGFPTHAHRGIDIVTWVVAGALTHTDSLGSPGSPGTTLTPGSVGVLSAGSGVEHSEIAASPATRFVQVWLPSDASEQPSYAVRPVDLSADGFSPAVAVGAAALRVARLDAGEEVSVPQAPLRHLFVSSGALLRNSLAEPLQAGDAFAITGDDVISVTAAVPTELLLWTFDEVTGGDPNDRT
jgi:quercetin 2,3-dioxygenase